MSREEEIADLMRADSILSAFLSGGIYTDQGVGVEGIRRGEGAPTENAFDDQGRLLPCALVHQRGLIPEGGVWDLEEKVAGTSQVVEIYFYQFRGHDLIDAAKERAYFVLIGQRLPRSYPIMWDYETSHIPDVGPIANSTTLRQDWRVVGIRRP
jgi:hypothetical protein